MEMLKNFIFAFSCAFVLTALQVHAQSQSGFISIDCGIPENSGYTDKITGINYTSDANFIETGIRKNISFEYYSHALEQQFLNVRSFPEGTRNCYTLKLPHGNTVFLIRARFMYGNYDGQRKPPKFDLLLEADVWDSVEFQDARTIVSKELIHIPNRNYLYVCLANTGSGTPFISALEIRPLANSTYEAQSGSLLLFLRWDVGSTTNETIRYKDDIYDRIWSPYTKSDWVTLSSSLTLYSLSIYEPPSSVTRTAVTPANGGNSLQFGWKSSNPSFKYYFHFYFAEVEKLQANQTREFLIYLNGRVWYDEPEVPRYLSTDSIDSTWPDLSEEKMEFSINQTEDSKLPPILNAFEAYLEKEFPQLLTNQQDVDAIMNIKSKYGVKKNWQGDPCAPEAYRWQGLNCSNNGYDPPKITSLNLSSSGLLGEISAYIFSLTMIETLDLSNNTLSGPIPDLSQLRFLRVLNLTGNKLKGSVPTGLIERKKNGLLSLSVDGNPDLCSEASCRENNKLLIPVAAVPVVAIVIAFCVLITAMAIIWSLKTSKQLGKTNGPSFEFKNRRFSYSDVVRITNNFERVLGEGGFGRVYHGYLDDTQVAVKMLAPSSVQGCKQFKAEVELLMRVHHINLTTLVGYCDEHNMGLIYEFMANGNLQAHLLDDDEDLLSWEGRLRIATDAAQGLDYLHRGCKPPIVHRDVKGTNILLNENFQAKLADFGLSRTFPVEGRTHVSTAVAGTPGYLDPEYYISNRTTEKSDVYGFGVVLLQIITSKPVIEKSDERTHISQWVSFMLAKADITNIVDRRLQGDFDINSVWKAVDIAMACVSPISAKRPTMNQVLTELNESLEFEIVRKKFGMDTEAGDFSQSINLTTSPELSEQIK